MERLKAPAARSASRELQRASANAPTISYRSDNLPKVRNLQADVEIPQSAWSSWIPEVGPRRLRRPLTPEQRETLERRRDELAPAVAGYSKQDLDRVATALGQMFGGFTSMRQVDAEMVAKLDSVCRVLTPFPAWAIEKACFGIQMNGIWRDGKYDRRWPPNDSEIIEAVRSHYRLFADQHTSAVLLLAATVEE